MRIWAIGLLATTSVILGSSCGRAEVAAPRAEVREFDYKSHLMIITSNKEARTFDVRVANLAGQTIHEGHFASPEPDQLEGILGSSGPLDFPIPADRDAAEVLASYVHGLVVLWSKEGRDHAGCDVLDELTDASCSSRGNCCDTHDKCYADNGCGVTSCGPLRPDCCVCDAQVVACVTVGFGSTGHASECCWWDNCGQDGGWYEWGDHGAPWCDWWCSPHCYCI